MREKAYVRRNRQRSWGAVALAPMILAACGSPTPAGTVGVVDAAITDRSVTDAPVTDATSTDATDASVSSAAIGTFQVQLVAPGAAGAGYTSVVGRVQDGPTPAQIVWEQRVADGDCRLMVPRVPFCNTPCGGSAVCVENDTCRPYPTAQSVGVARVSGVRTSTGATSFELSLVANTYQVGGGVMLPYPAFSEGDALRVEAAGSAWNGAFSLETRGIAPLALSAGALRIQTGQALEVAWTAAGQPGPRILVRLDISHHGGTRGKIECNTADDGALTISADLVTRLVALGVAGFPTIVVTRASTGSTTIRAGRVDLTVSSEVETGVEIPNLRSCTSDTECDGGMCRADLTCG